MHVEIFPKQMLVEFGIIDMNHAGLGKSRQHLVCTLSSIISTCFQGGGTESRMEAGEAVPGFIDDHLDAFGMRSLDDRRQVIAETIVGATGEYERLGIGMFFD